jgi:hypothetical protein
MFRRTREEELVGRNGDGAPDLHADAAGSAGIEQGAANDGMACGTWEFVGGGSECKTTGDRR